MFPGQKQSSVDCICLYSKYVFLYVTYVMIGSIVISFLRVLQELVKIVVVVLRAVLLRAVGSPMSGFVGLVIFLPRSHSRCPTPL